MKNKIRLKVSILFFLIVHLFGCQVDPKDLNPTQNLFQGITQSKASVKPMLIYFTCYACMGYNEFHNDLIQSQAIFNKLNEEFVTVELYVDDKKPIQEADTIKINEIIESERGAAMLKQAKTIGNINATIQMELINNNAQPYYVITDSELNILVDPFGYTNKNQQFFLEKLELGIAESRKEK